MQNSKIHFKLQMLGFVILKWRPFEYKAEFSKNASFIWVQNGYFWYIFKKTIRRKFWKFTIVINSNWKFQTRATISHKMAAL